MTTQSVYLISNATGLIDTSVEYELGFAAYEITASDGITRSNAHYIYRPNHIGLVISGKHVSYMYVVEFDKHTNAGIAISNLGQVKFVVNQS